MRIAGLPDYRLTPKRECVVGAKTSKLNQDNDEDSTIEMICFMSRSLAPHHDQSDTAAAISPLGPAGTLRWHVLLAVRRWADGDLGICGTGIGPHPPTRRGSDDWPCWVCARIGLLSFRGCLSPLTRRAAVPPIDFRLGCSRRVIPHTAPLLFVLMIGRRDRAMSGDAHGANEGQNLGSKQTAHWPRKHRQNRQNKRVRGG